MQKLIIDFVLFSQSLHHNSLSHFSRVERPIFHNENKISDSMGRGHFNIDGIHKLIDQRE